MQESILGKRNLLYEMLLQLSGVDKRVALSDEEVKREIAELENRFFPYLTSIPIFLDKLLNYMHHHVEDKIDLKEIKNLEILQTGYNAIDEIKFSDSRLIGAKSALLGAVNDQIQSLRGEEPQVKERKEDPDQL